MSNPVSIPIPASSQGVINCVANAAYYQRVTLTWGSTTVVFAGTGEGTPMTTADGETTAQIPPTPDAFNIQALFEFSTNGSSGPFSPATVREPVISNKGGFNVAEVMSEDSTDNDNNDSYLTVATVAR